mmetsp:Transcript_39269/g.80068  ORF Transcript_39269/g.80068 Transcript_39269/m.80068 type:complete len:239 (-) Transcript_39269:45-761(-)
MTELRIGELVNGARGVHGEITPNRGRGTEVQFLDAAAGGLEPSLGVLGRDADGDAVTAGRDALCGLEVDGRLAVAAVVLEPLLPVQLPDLGDVVQRYSHGHLQLRRGEVHARDHLRDRMLHLKTGVQLQEVELLLGLGVQVLHGARVGVPHGLGQGHRGLFHLIPNVGPGRDGGPLLDDLLMTALKAAIPLVQVHRVPVAVRRDLNLDVTRIDEVPLQDDPIVPEGRETFPSARFEEG